jgi:hypothetical protein
MHFPITKIDASPFIQKMDMSYFSAIFYFVLQYFGLCCFVLLVYYHELKPYKSCNMVVLCRGRCKSNVHDHEAGLDLAAIM